MQIIFILLCHILLYSNIISIRGIIRPPKDGDYTFQIVSDGAVSLEINKSIELDHFLSDRNKGVGDTPFGKPVKTQKKIHFNAG